MKKISSLLLALMLMVSGISFGQTTKAAGAKVVTTQSKQTKETKEVKKETTKTAPAVTLKKDGTPDKRYKTNKKLKKDGTPDKRYKENQASPTVAH
jgi:ABC-type glycerol-3-phosphate transport system substrate-binding protein